VAAAGRDGDVVARPQFHAPVLEAQSRALDSDEAEGRSADPTTDDDDDDRRASDAGVDSAIARGLGG